MTFTGHVAGCPAYSEDYCGEERPGWSMAVDVDHVTLTFRTDNVDTERGFWLKLEGTAIN